MSEVWLITDATERHGRELAEMALRAGGCVVAGTREPGQLAALVARYGRRVRTVVLDVTDEASLYAAVDTALTAFGRIDVAVNPAVPHGAASPADMTDTDLRAGFESAFFGLAAVAHAVLPVLREQRGGRFVQVVARHGRARSAAHLAAAAALTGYLAALAGEMAPYGVEIGFLESAESSAAACGSAADAPGKLGREVAARAKPSAHVLRFSARPRAA